MLNLPVWYPPQPWEHLTVVFLSHLGGQTLHFHSPREIREASLKQALPALAPNLTDKKVEAVGGVECFMVHTLLL